MTPLEEARRRRGWKRTRLLSELYRVAHQRGVRLPEPESLERQVRYFEKGQRSPGEQYQELFCAVYGCEPAELGFVRSLAEAEQQPESMPGDEVEELTRRLALGSAVDPSLVELLEAQTQNFRLLDRRLGAGQLITQSLAHVAQMEELLRYAVCGSSRSALARALTEASALAGWQALDLGRPRVAWDQHEIAKAAGREAEDPVVLAHATAQQAYVLLDLGRPKGALALVRHAHERDASRLPSLLRAWLYMAEGEMLAALGNEVGCRQALDAAERLLPRDAADPDMPFLVLDEVHLARWRGHCLARLGASEAVDDLTAALKSMDKSFTRAEAGLRCDLALAHLVRGEREEARRQAREAAALATSTRSSRQQRRIAQLLAA